MKVKEIDQFSLDLLKSLSKNVEICGIIRSVAPSGMSRTMSFIVPAVDKYTNEPTTMNITYAIADLLGYKMISVNGRNAIRVNGCGMDMIFKVVYDLGKVLHGDGYYFSERQL